MTTQTYTDERRWANTDPSLHFNCDTRSKEPRWQGSYIYCLKMRDYDAAELIMKLNLVSDECAYQDHDLCHFSWCSCPHHSVVQFALEHPQLRSLRQAEQSTAS